MSRAFVKEDDAGAPEERVDLPVSEHPNLVTPAGLQMLRDKLGVYEAERAKLKEHDDELAAQSHLPRVEQEVRYWEERLRSAIPVHVQGSHRERFRARRLELEHRSSDLHQPHCSLRR